VQSENERTLLADMLLFAHCAIKEGGIFMRYHLS